MTLYLRSYLKPKYAASRPLEAMRVPPVAHQKTAGTPEAKTTGKPETSLKNGPHAAACIQKPLDL
jgi:hypothetical protein